MIHEDFNESDLGKRLFGDFFDFDSALFGLDSNGEWKRPMGKTRTEAKMESLIRTFEEGVAKGEFEYLKIAVVDYQSEVTQMSNADLFQAHAKACIFVEDLERAISSYNEVSDLSEKEKAVVGLIAYQHGDKKLAFRYLHHIKEIIPDVKLTLSSIYILNGQVNTAVHSKVLEKIADSSADANVVLGIVNFNEGKFPEAEECFSKAISMGLNTEPVRLNLMMAQISQGRKGEVYESLSQFYHDTQSQLSPEQLEFELNERHINFPIYEADAKTLFKILKD